MKERTAKSKIQFLGIFIFSITIFWPGWITVSGAEIRVKFGLNRIEPDIITVNVGDTIVWSKTDAGGPISLEEYGGAWESPPLVGQGATFSHTIINPGDFTYANYWHIQGEKRYTKAGRVIVRSWTNNPPPITINFPSDGTIFSEQEAYVPFIVSTEIPAENVQNVKFFLDGKLIGSTNSAPFSIYLVERVGLPHGRHTLLASVTDYDGNISQSQSVQIFVDPPFVARISNPVILPTGEFRFHYSFPGGFDRWMIQSSDDLKIWVGRFERTRFGIWVDEDAVFNPKQFYRLRDSAN